MAGEVWKQRDVARAFLADRSRQLPDRGRQIQVLLRLLRTIPGGPRRVLDLGAGDGVLLGVVLAAFPEARGVALDFSPPMLEQARLRLAGFGERAAVVAADLTTPDWRAAAPGRFDAVVSGYAIHHLPNIRKRALYEEIFALLSAGGWFVNCEHVASATPCVERLFDEMMSEQLHEQRRGQGEDVTAEQVFREYLTRPDRAANILVSVEEQCGWLRDIGFGDVDCYWKYFELAVFGGSRKPG